MCFRRLTCVVRSRLFWGVVALAGLVALHPLLLCGGARLLVVDQPRGAVSHLVLVARDSAADRRHAVAADFVRRNPAGRVLLIEAEPDTLVRCGIVPADEVLDRQALAERAVPAAAIELIRGAAADRWQAMHSLQRWLDAHPDARAAVLCDRFDSRLQRSVADAVLTPDAARRVTIWALPKREFDERNWWRTRRGARSLVYAWLSLTFHTLCGEPQEAERNWHPDGDEWGDWGGEEGGEGRRGVME
jgi:hypothetical protein